MSEKENFENCEHCEKNEDLEKQCYSGTQCNLGKKYDSNIHCLTHFIKTHKSAGGLYYYCCSNNK